VELIPQENARGDVARALVLSEVFSTPYSEMPLYALERALAGGSDEYRMAEVGDPMRALAVYGAVAGTVGTARLFIVAPASPGSRGDAAAALQSVLAQLKSEGARLLIAELPDDSACEGMRKLLLESGFREESRVDDLIRDGVALTFLRYEIT
jgi:hypothetical protein